MKIAANKLFLKTCEEFLYLMRINLKNKYPADISEINAIEIFELCLYGYYKV